MAKTGPKPEPLRFPRGVRFPRKNEVPKGNNDVFERIAAAYITTGYIRNDDGGDTYSTYFEANVHADEVFAVFQKLARSVMPEIASPAIGIKGKDPIFGPYTSRKAAIEVLEEHSELLQHDGFLEFGITFQYKNRIEEIFVKSPKYFQIWTNNPDSIVQVFDECRIPFVSKLEFIDEYPMVSKSINKMNNAAWPAVYESVTEAFKSLPEAYLDN